MTRLGLSALAILAFCAPALSATVGANCRGNSIIFVAPSVMKAENCALSNGCRIGFKVKGGYYAIAQSVDGQKFSASAGGFRKAASANERAISRCEDYGATACTVIAKGHDNNATYRNCE